MELPKSDISDIDISNLDKVLDGFPCLAGNEREALKRWVMLLWQESFLEGYIKGFEGNKSLVAS